MNLKTDLVICLCNEDIKARSNELDLSSSGEIRVGSNPTPRIPTFFNYWYVIKKVLDRNQSIMTGG